MVFAVNDVVQSNLLQSAVIYYHRILGTTPFEHQTSLEDLGAATLLVNFVVYVHVVKGPLHFKALVQL